MAKIHEALCKAMADVEAIGKNQKNEAQGFKFRGIDDVYNSLHSIFVKHNLVAVPVKCITDYHERIGNNGKQFLFCRVNVRYQIMTDDGSFVEAEICGESGDAGDKSTSKALSIAYKYLLFQTFLIPTEELDDPDKYVIEDTKPVQPAKRPDDQKAYIDTILVPMIQAGKLEDIQKNSFKTELSNCSTMEQLKELSSRWAKIIGSKGEVF